MACSYCRDKMLQAYEFALDKVGLDFNSYQARVPVNFLCLLIKAM